MRKFIIERELPAIGSAERQALREAAQKSNATLRSSARTSSGSKAMSLATRPFASTSPKTRRSSMSMHARVASRPQGHGNPPHDRPDDGGSLTGPIAEMCSRHRRRQIPVWRGWS